MLIKELLTSCETSINKELLWFFACRLVILYLAIYQKHKKYEGSRLVPETMNPLYIH